MPTNVALALGTLEPVRFPGAGDGDDRVDEQTVVDLRPHWSFMAGPVAAVAVVLLVALGVAVVVPGGPPSWAAVGLAVLLVVAAAWLVGRYARWTTTRLLVTSERVVVRSGVLARRGREIPLERVNDIGFRQSILERLVGSGDLVIESGGERGQEVFDHVAQPSAVQRSIYAQMNQMNRRWTGQGGLSIPEQIEKLDELWRRGIITRAELDSKKTQLLDRL